MNLAIKELLSITGWLVAFFPVIIYGRVNESSACLGLTGAASLYLQNSFGTKPALVWGNYDGRDLAVCSRRSQAICCSKRHEDVFLANAFKFISRFSRKTLSDVLRTQSDKMSGQVQDLLNKTMEKVRYRLSTTFRVPERELSAPLAALFAQLPLSAPATAASKPSPAAALKALLQAAPGAISAAEGHFETFFRAIFPSVFVYHLGGSSDLSRGFRDCLRASYGQFRPRPFLRLPADYGRRLQTALMAHRALLGGLGVSATLIRDTTGAPPSQHCLRGLVRLRLCHLCAAQNVSRPCAGVCENVHRGCFAHLLPLRAGWTAFVLSLRRLVDAITAGQSLVRSLRAFDATILKAVQQATHNVASYGQQVITQCMHTADLSANTNASTSPASTTAAASPEPETRHGARAARNVEIADPELQPRLNVIRSLLTNNQLFFELLPNQFCKGLRSRHCWNGTHQSPTGYSRVVRNFADEHQRVNPEVQMKAPESFPMTEVENQNNVLLQLAKRLSKFVAAHLLPRTPAPPTRGPEWRLPTVPRELKERRNLRLPAEGSGGRPAGKSRLPDDDEDRGPGGRPGGSGNRLLLPERGEESGSGAGPFSSGREAVPGPRLKEYEYVTAPVKPGSPGLQRTSPENGAPALSAPTRTSWAALLAVWAAWLAL